MQYIYILHTPTHNYTYNWELYVVLLQLTSLCIGSGNFTVRITGLTYYMSVNTKYDIGFDIHMSKYHNIIPNYSHQGAKFLDLFIFYRRSTCFRRFLRPSSGARNCTYSFRYCQPLLLWRDGTPWSSISSTVAASSSIGWQYLKLYIQLCAPDDGWRNRLKHVERL
jgi:hypothetical protein